MLVVCQRPKKLLKYLLQNNNEKKKILLIHSLPSPYRNPLLEKLAKDKDLDITIFFMAKSAKNRIWDSSQLNFKHKFLPSLTLNVPLRDDIIPIWNNPTVPWEIAKGGYDLVICSGWDSTTTFIARISCYLLKIPMVVWAGSTENEKSIQRTLMYFPVKLLVKSSTALIAYGEASKNYLIKLGARPEKVFVSFNSVDINLFRNIANQSATSKQQIRSQLGITNKYLILFVGQLITRKGVMDLYDVVKKISKKIDVGIMWLGYGPLKEELKALIVKDKLSNNYFATTQNAKDTAKMYAIADIFVLPTYEDIYSNVVAEALSSGLPVITTKENGAGIDYIKEGINGYTFNAGDKVELKKILSDVLNNPSKLRMLAEQTWGNVKDFNYDENLIKFKEMVAYATSK